MSDIKPNVADAANDILESWIADGRYPDPCSVKPAVRIILDELTRVQAELNRAAGEIVKLREEVKCAACGNAMKAAHVCCHDCA